MTLAPIASRFRVLALLLVAACGDSTTPVSPLVSVRKGIDAGPGSGTSGSPTFVSAASDAPAIANPVVSFYAKLGEDRTAVMWYHASAGRTDSVAFLRFRVRAKSLAFRPDGTPFAPGDSVRITITLADPVHLGIDCQPAGLRFSRSHPADMKLSFAEIDPDVNHDGVVDRTDDRLVRSLAIWRRELFTDPWFKQPSTVDLGLHEVESDILGFSSYIVAY